MDISQQKEETRFGPEKSRRQARIKRIEALRTMAGAIAYGVNNTLMVVLESLEMLDFILPRHKKGRRPQADARRPMR